MQTERVYRSPCGNADPGDARFVYAVWDRLQSPMGAVINPELVFGLGFKGPAMLARTTDGGQTWEPARKIYEPGANNQTIAGLTSDSAAPLCSSKRITTA